MAALLHLGVLAVIGLRAPGFVARDADSRATMDIEIVPMPGLLERPRKAPAPTKPAPRLAKPRAVEALSSPSPLVAPVPSTASVQAAAAPPVGEGPSVGCEREVLLLLTTAERERCRNQLAADAERRARAGQAARDAETVREARAQPKVDLIPAEKRAYYDAVQTSRREMRAGKDFEKLAEIQNKRPAAGGRDTSIDINVAFPKCSLKFGANKQKAKAARGLIRLWPLPCSYQVQRGPLTEDAGTPAP